MFSHVSKIIHPIQSELLEFYALFPNFYRCLLHRLIVCKRTQKVDISSNYCSYIASFSLLSFLTISFWTGLHSFPSHFVKWQQILVLS